MPSQRSIRKMSTARRCTSAVASADRRAGMTRLRAVVDVLVLVAVELRRRGRSRRGGWPGARGCRGPRPRSPGRRSLPRPRSIRRTRRQRSMASRIASTVLAFETPTDEPMFAGFTNTGRPNSAAIVPAVPDRPRARGTAMYLAWGTPFARQHLFGHRLVHGDRGGQHTAADVRHAHQLEQALHRAVLAHRTVQQRHDDRGAGSIAVGEDRGRRRRWRRRSAPAAGSVGALLERRQAPTAASAHVRRGRCRWGDAVLRGVGGPQHVRGRVQLTSCSAGRRRRRSG